MGFNTPILFLIFNRLESAVLVFEEIKKQKPKFLFIAADGPRRCKVEESEQCKVVRNTILDLIDWDCEVKTLFRKENLGCGLAVSEAITWFFKSVEAGIILEDDCLPHPDFFSYCEILLHKYENDKSISLISGLNLQRGIKRGNASYYFSANTYIWGWATWRRVWATYEFDLSKLDKRTLLNNIRVAYSHPYERKILKSIYIKMINNAIDTWDFQFSFGNIYYKRLSIVPNVNLISNIGLGGEATHTGVGTNGGLFYLDTNSILPIIETEIVHRDWNADNFYFKTYLYKSMSEILFDYLISIKRFLLKPLGIQRINEIRTLFKHKI